MAAKAELTVVQQNVPADGFRDDFERRLFQPIPYHARGNGGSETYRAWIEEMRELMGQPEQRLADMKARSRPLKLSEPATDGYLSRQAGDMLRPIGAKIAPHLSGEQATAWRKAVVMALSDLPAHAILSALPKALHKPMRFLSDVETEVRQIADKEICALNVAIDALCDLTNSSVWRVPRAIEPPAQEFPM